MRDDLSYTSHRFFFRYRKRLEVKGLGTLKIREISSALAYRKCEVLIVIFTGKDSASYHEVNGKVYHSFFGSFSIVIHDLPGSPCVGPST